MNGSFNEKPQRSESFLNFCRDCGNPMVLQPAQPGAAVNRCSIIIAIAQISRASMEPDTHLQRCRDRPGLVVQPLLDGYSRCNGIDGVLEYCKATVSLAPRADDHTVRLGDS